jgi:hypothetical protein
MGLTEQGRDIRCRISAHQRVGTAMRNADMLRRVLSTFKTIDLK